MCATSDTLTDLVIGRAIQGFGGGGLLPVALALAGDTLGRKGQLAGIGFVSAVETIGWILGPIYGAAVTDLFGFADRTLAVGVLAQRSRSSLGLWFVLRGLARSPDTRPKPVLSRLDLPGALLLSIALVTLNLALGVRR